jgi:hypothetical protein
MYAVKIACERPDELGRSLSQWDCTEIARQLVRDGVVSSISAETVRRILVSHRLKPWRLKMWLSPKVPRDAAFAAQVREICDLSTRSLRPDEVVLCVDEMTSLQPRPRKSKTLPTDPGRARVRPLRGVELVRGLRHADGKGLWHDGLAKAASGVHRVPGAA